MSAVSTPTNRNLHKGSTVFFAAQPKFTNVDIRVTIDVTFREVEVYVSNSHDTFIVEVDLHTGIHAIKIEDESAARGGASGGDKETPPSPMKVYANSSSSLGGPMLPNTPLQLHAKPQGADREVREAKTEGLISYITVWKPQTVLIVRGVRVVITFPNEVHSLKSSRFYIALRGVGTDERRGEFQGLLFLRQDQAHIDLFVFFSCFFLFLCVLLWKIKQFMDFHREQRRHIQEMTKMASRPFAKLTVYLEPDEPQLSSGGGGVGGSALSLAHARTGKLGAVVVGQRGRAPTNTSQAQASPSTITTTLPWAEGATVGNTCPCITSTATTMSPPPPTPPPPILPQRLPALLPLRPLPVPAHGLLLLHLQGGHGPHPAAGGHPGP
ncbi:multiple epidermal growth factor-like domains protein 8 [Salvelinus namaycush]|uniref:Multiple epidermal growth factor-like domains protein 8 n=1 Tax=Salvelinus namaycush TaxID=8040 RepID=A0A8U0QY35_SALNM|nr:multiple epidermal growth factor-like domains protein 8 [Salvelinus namaycush]